MKAALLLLSLPLAAAVTFVPQDPPQNATAPAANEEVAAVVRLSDLQYIDRQGNTVVVSARNVVEIRVFEDVREHIRIELLYENLDYSLIDAQALHLLRNGASARDVKLVRSKMAAMRWPRLP